MIIHDYLMTFLSPSMTKPRVVLVAHVDASITESFLQLFRLSAYGHDVARGNRQEIVCIVHLVILVDGDDLEPSSFDILDKGLI